MKKKKEIEEEQQEDQTEVEVINNHPMKDLIIKPDNIDEIEQKYKDAETRVKQKRNNEMLQNLVGSGFNDKLVEVNAINTIETWDKEIERLWNENNKSNNSNDNIEWSKRVEEKFKQDSELNQKRSEIHLIINNIKNKRNKLPIGFQTERLEEKLTACSKFLNNSQLKVYIFINIIIYRI